MTVFTKPLNDISAKLSIPYVAGSGVFTFTSTSMFGSPSPSDPIRVTARYGASLAIFKITGSTSTTLTVNSAIEGTSDIGFPADTEISMDFTAGHLSDAYTAINSLESTVIFNTQSYSDPSWITTLSSSKIVGNILESQVTNLVSDLASVVHKTGAENITGPKTFDTVIVTSSISGGILPSGDLTILSTNDGLKGKVYFNGTATYINSVGGFNSTTTAGIAVQGNATNNQGVYGNSLLHNGGHFQQSGTLTASITRPALYALRSSTLNGFTSTGAVIRAEDSSGSTGNLIECVTTSGVVCSITSAGFLSMIQTLDTTSNSQNITQTASILQSNTAATGTDYTMAALNVAFPFVAGAAHNIRGINLRIKASALLTNPVSGLTARIFTDNSGQPGAAISGTSAGTVKFGSLTTSYVSVPFSPGSVVALTSGTTYWIVITQSAAPAGGTVIIDGGATPISSIATSPDGTTWAVGSAVPLWYQIQGRTGVSISATSTVGAAINGSSTHGIGVTANSSTNVALYGASTNNIASMGVSNNSVGVQGISINSTGVQGISTTGNGVLGTSGSGVGVSAISTSNVGVQGVSTSNAGVSGSSTSSTGVIGTSTQQIGGQFKQAGTATASSTSPCLHAQRTSTLGAFDFTGPVLRVEDTTAASSKLIEAVKQGSTIFSLDTVGVLTTKTVATSVVSKTSSYTITTTDSIVLANATTGGFVLTLPLASLSTGKTLTVKKTDNTTNVVTILGSGTDKIDGASTYLLEYAYEFVTLVSDGSNWFVIAQ